MKQKRILKRTIVFGLVFTAILVVLSISPLVIQKTKACLFEGLGPFQAGVDHIAGGYIGSDGKWHQIHYIITSYPRFLEDTTPLIVKCWEVIIDT